MALYRICYGRVSSEEQNLELQIEQFDKLGYDEIFTEKESGRHNDRPEFARLTERALDLREQGHDVNIYVVEWSRWARKAWFALQQLEKLEEAGCKVVEITTGQPVTVSTSSGLMTAGINSLFADYFSRQLSERVERSYESRRAKGVPMAGAPPLGYTRSEDGSHLVPGKDWKIAREVVERFVQGDTLRSICVWLNEEHGIKRSSTGIVLWLKRPALRGHIQYKDGTIYRDAHTPLLTLEDQLSVESQLRRNKRLKGSNKKRVYGVSASLVRCVHCENTMQTSSNGYRRYFLCKHTREGGCTGPRKLCREDAIEKAIVEAIFNRAEELVDAFLSPTKNSDPEILEKEMQLRGLQALPRSSVIDTAISAIEAEIKNLNTSSEEKVATDCRRRETLLAMKGVSFADWMKLPPEERESLYDDLVKAAWIDGSAIVSVELKV